MFFGFFDGVPLVVGGLDVCGDVAGGVAGEDVGSAGADFVGDGGGDVVDGEGVVGVVLGESGVPEDLEEYVAEFFAEFGAVVGADGVEEFVGFFEGVFGEGGVGLLEGPGAAAGA